MKTIDQYELFKLLLNDMGETGWWPADSKVEIIIGAIMIQNTNAANAKRAVNNIGSATQFNPQVILNLPLETLEDLVRPAGFFKNKSKAVHSVLNWFQEHDNNLEAITEKYEINLRQELLKLHGVGDETADVLLLYVFEQPVFVSDKYAQKLYTELGVSGMDNYRAMRKTVSLDKQFTTWEAKEFHGLIDEFGKIYLRGKGNFEASFLAGYQLKIEE